MTIKNCFRHGCFIRTKHEDNPDVIENSADISEEAYEGWINIDANLETAEKTAEETICQARMNRRDDGIELDDNDDEEDLEEKLPSAQEILQVLRTLRRSDQYCAESFDEHYSYVGWLFCVSWRKNHFCPHCSK
ncbi:hypothetical protein AVEN_258487-1 [Araneus ventricosus]|uniref:Uncharacterized protein n=1 Tax=Araneus ventricosus TaxID=182803 RepID=A0A4Y2H9Z5_ARAVE|nr:hypothetical protein AVEN_258487-1 [Araneus ventricosus]